MIDKIKIRVNKPSESGLFHDSRGDAKRLGIMCNILIDKVNELIEANNRLEKELSKYTEKK